jgi:hypothetical protein
MAQVSPCAEWPEPQKVVTFSVLTKTFPASFVLQTHINIAFERRGHPIPLIKVLPYPQRWVPLGLRLHPPLYKIQHFRFPVHIHNLVRCCPDKSTYPRSYDLEYSCRALALPLPCFLLHITRHGHTHGHTINLDSFVAFQRGISCQRCYRCIDKVLHVKL